MHRKRTVFLLGFAGNGPLGPDEMSEVPETMSARANSRVIK
jgi:hypothetical protein